MDAFYAVDRTARQPRVSRQAGCRRGGPPRRSGEGRGVRGELRGEDLRHPVRHAHLAGLSAVSARGVRDAEDGPLRRDVLEGDENPLGVHPARGTAQHRRSLSRLQRHRKTDGTAGEGRAPHQGQDFLGDPPHGERGGGGEQIGRENRLRARQAGRARRLPAGHGKGVPLRAPPQAPLGRGRQDPGEAREPRFRHDRPRGGFHPRVPRRAFGKHGRKPLGARERDRRQERRARVGEEVHLGGDHLRAGRFVGRARSNTCSSGSPTPSPGT